jgi:hypothetical protein
VISASCEVRALNAVCPYFTMFPIEFPLRALARQANGLVVDPFCGRGTTNLAARLYGLSTIGVDSSPVAAAATQAKLPRKKVTPEQIVALTTRLISNEIEPTIPKGEFWSLAYDQRVLRDLSRLREALISDCGSDAAKALRGILLGALHGPKLINGGSSYLSNQAPRTYAPKPRYAIKFWKRNRMRPPDVNVLSIIRKRAERAYNADFSSVRATVRQGDSRVISWRDLTQRFGKIDWVITSPPYYGLKTYRQDQWLREWFLGGSPDVQYDSCTTAQVRHSGPEEFVEDLRTVWRALSQHATDRARLLFRFGSINDRPVDARSLALASVNSSGWHVRTVTAAGFSDQGRRQAASFSSTMAPPIEEFDVWCARD